ncbi:MAG: UbiH/UbiF family hydroxylase [Rhizobiaceae bacterium]
MENHFSISVVGGGLAGLTAALRLAPLCEARGGQLALIAPISTSEDLRTTAMMMPSIEMLKRMEVWGTIEKYSTPLRTMRLVDGSERLIRSPVTDFRSSEMGLDAFGYNVPNNKMIQLLEETIAKAPSIKRFDALLKQAECHEDKIELHLSSKLRISAQLAVAADGRRSLLRDAAQITTREKPYPQTALALTFSHSQPHNGVSAEFHTETGPFTQVPLPPSKTSKHRSSLVWSVRPEQVDELIAKSLPELSTIIEAKLQSCYGKITVEHAPQAFPLSSMTANTFGANRVALVGESAHVFPPIGAQGFNLGLRDIEELENQLINANNDFGNDVVLSSYSKKRMFDINSRTGSIDIMNRSLLTDFLPIQAARAIGIAALGNIPWLRRFAMKQGLGVR